MFDDQAFTVKSRDDLLSANGNESYAEISDRLTNSTIHREPGRISNRILTRGRVPVVDAILEHLKNAFLALEQRVLAGLVFSVCLKADRPQNVLESYSFTFTYHQTANGLETMMKIDMTDGPNVITFGDVKLSIMKVLSKISDELADRPCLPNRKFIHIRLLYNDDFDEKVNIPGFRSDFDVYNVANAPGWEYVNYNVRSTVLDAGHQGYGNIQQT